MKRVLVPLAPGFEEIEAITIIDILRRAGVEVVVAGTVPGVITAAHQTKHMADCLLADVTGQPFDLIILPGGMPGTTNLRQDPHLAAMLQKQRPVAAICAAPTVLAAYGLLAGKKATCYPGFEEAIVKGTGTASRERVVVDGDLITSQAPGTAMEFAFKLVEYLCGPAAATKLNQAVYARL